VYLIRGKDGKHVNGALSTFEPVPRGPKYDNLIQISKAVDLEISIVLVPQLVHYSVRT